MQIHSLPTNFPHNNVFNDLAFQWFPSDAVIPKVEFSRKQVEKEHFEINQDEL